MIEYRVEVFEDRTEWYNLEGELHREDGPALEWANGDKSWWINGQLRREDGPAVEFADGTKYWWLNGKNVTEQEFLKRTQVTELTLDQIAEKFNISVDKLKIKK